MRRDGRFQFLDLMVLGVAAAMIAVALFDLEIRDSGVVRETTTLGGAPATVFRAAPPLGPTAAAPAPVAVIAHGFAGSRQLMQSFAISLARAGFVAVTYDALGHGRNPAPLTGDVTKEEGATQALLAELARVSEAARALPGVDGRLALLGHSMSSDIVVRRAQADPAVETTVAISMFARTVDGESPENLLILVGAWERFLTEEALRALALAHGPGGAYATGADPVEPGVTYGSFAEGSARRVALAENAEHIGVLFAETGMRETAAWLRGAFDFGVEARPEARGATLALLFLGVALLAWPLSRLLPLVARERLGAELPAARLLWVALPPAIVTPLLLWRLPIEFLPVAIADYLAAHFLVYGLLTALGLWLAGGFRRDEPLAESPRSWAAFGVAAALFILFFLGVLGLAIDRYFTSFLPTETRLVVIGAVLVGALAFFLSDEWLTRGDDAPLWGYALTKILFLASLAAAVALDLERLFFLIIILPLILVFFILFGLWSGWTYRATRDPGVAGVGAAVALAWSLGVSFPLLAS